VHVHRVSIRLGLIGKKVTAQNAHALLQALLPQDARSIYNFHKALLRHGQRICVFERPRCNKCPITDLCDYYHTVVKRNKDTCVYICLFLILNVWISPVVFQPVEKGLY
jgi:endonuclease III